MKRLLFLGLLLCTSHLYGLDLFTRLLPKGDIGTRELVTNAIKSADFNTVFANINSDTPQSDLITYSTLAQTHLGRPIPVSISRKALAAGKIALSISLLYKLTDYFKSEIQCNKDFLLRYKSLHNIMMDLGSIAGCISFYDLLNSAANETFNHQVKYKKQLLIHLHLKSLITRA
jgi:hypothetical protein